MRTASWTGDPESNLKSCVRRRDWRLFFYSDLTVKCSHCHRRSLLIRSKVQTFLSLVTEWWRNQVERVIIDVSKWDFSSRYRRLFESLPWVCLVDYWRERQWKEVLSKMKISRYLIPVLNQEFQILSVTFKPIYLN